MTTIAGTGCSLLDFIHADVDFSSRAFAALGSKSPGDGGLEPGKLVFAEDFEAFVGTSMDVALAPLLGQDKHPTCNVGGPGVIAMAHASQILVCRNIQVAQSPPRPGVAGRALRGAGHKHSEYYGTLGSRDGGPFVVDFCGALGDDANAGRLLGMLAPTGLNLERCVRKSGRTPMTLVLSDPRYHSGRGERCFINLIGAAGMLGATDLNPEFFASDITVFGGTALTPALHDSLGPLLARCRDENAFIIVNTVYDFRNQRRDPLGRWPLGSDDASYANIDLLVVDHEEALRLSGGKSAREALGFFRARGVGAAVVTAGTEEIIAASWKGDRVAPLGERAFPVSRRILEELSEHPERRGDTTGCGDNFVGGIIAAAAMQLEAGARRVALDECLAWAVASGGLACFHVGGLYREAEPGEKRRRLEPYVDAWRAQVGYHSS